MPQYITQLRHVLKHEACTLSDVVVTHWHADHLGGLPHVLGSLHTHQHESKLHITTRLTCRRTLLTLLTFAETDCRVWKHPGEGGRCMRPSEQMQPEAELTELTDGQTLQVSDAN